MTAKPKQSLAARAAELEAEIMGNQKPRAALKALTYKLEWHHRDEALPDFNVWIVVHRGHWETDISLDWNTPTEYHERHTFAIGSRRKVRLTGADGWEWDVPKKMLDFEFWSYLGGPPTRKPSPAPQPSRRERAIAMRMRGSAKSES